MREFARSKELKLSY